MSRLLYERRITALILTTGVLARVLFIFLFPGVGNPEIMDSHAYDEIAMNIVSGTGFYLYNIPTAFVAPLYPFFLAGIYAVFGHSFIIAKIFNILLAAGTIFFIYLIACELFNRSVGKIAAGIVAIHPELVAITAFLYTESLNTFLLVFFLWALVRAINRAENTKFYWALSGLLLGLSTLTKGTTLMLPLFLFILFAVDRALRSKFIPFMIFISVFFITLIPWTIRNYVQFRIVLPVATGAGESMWTGNYFPFDGEYRYGQTQQKIEELSKGRPWIERDSILMREAKRMIKENPIRFVKLAVKKIARLWVKVYENVPQGMQRQENLMLKFGLMMIHLPLLIMAIAGMARSLLLNLQVRVTFYLLLYYTLVHAITFAVPRYRLPIMPFLIIFAAAFIYFMLKAKWNILIKRYVANTNNVIV